MGGAGVSLDLDLVQEAKVFAMPMIINTINKIYIDDMQVDNFEVKDMSINLNQVNPNDVMIGLSEVDNAVKLTANNVSGVIKGSFKYQWLLIFCHGDFELTIKQKGATILSSTPLESQIYQDKMLPAISFDLFLLDIDPDYIDISISGSIVADVANLFIQLLKGPILDMVMGKINGAVPPLMTQEVNTIFYNTHGVLVLDKLGELGVDFSYTAMPKVYNTQLDLFINGTVFNATYGERSPMEGAGDLAVDTTTVDCMQLDLSAYTVESFFLTFFEAGKLQMTVTNEMIPEASSLVFTTSSMEEFLPGLVEKYGADQPMALKVSATDFPRAIFTPADMGANLALDIALIVEGQGNALVLSFGDVLSMIKLSLTDFRLYPLLESIKIGTLVASESQIGEVNTDTIKTFLNLTFKAMLPILNIFLGKGIPIPHSLFGGKIILQSATFTSYQNYLRIGVSPKFQSSLFATE